MSSPSRLKRGTGVLALVQCPEKDGPAGELPAFPRHRSSPTEIVMRFSIPRLVSEFRRFFVARSGKVEIGRAGLLIGKQCSIRTWGAGIIRAGIAMHLEDRVALQSAGHIEIGSWVFINRDTMIVALEKIYIGEGTRIAERVSIRDHDHRFGDFERPVRDLGYVTKPIRIGRECWIGCNAVILKGVTIGDHSVIWAGAVVTRDIPARSLAAGIPARVIRSL